MTEPTLHLEAVTGADAPGRWIAFLHGIYGAGRNWSSVARRLVRLRPEWGVRLVDLRGHGASPAFDPPHTIHAAASDLLGAARSRGFELNALLGHSFGGKVALEALRLASEAGGPVPGSVWVIDSTPAAREPEGSAWEMLHTLRRTSGPFASREEGVAALEAEGVATPVARWMATNLETPDEGDVREGSGPSPADGRAWRWRLDLDAMEALLTDFFARDLWEVVESPPEGAALHLVRATESSVLTGDALARAEAAAAANDRVHLHTVEGGHWLNADNPDALVTLLAEGLAGGGAGA